MLDTEWKEKRLRLIGSIGLRGKPPYLEFARGKHGKIDGLWSGLRHFGVRECGTRVLFVLMCHFFSI
jgi:hypothetical protein